MEVSHFELIYKRQAPVGVGGAPAETVDTALQGYFLSITNLAAQSLQFRVEFVAQPPMPGQPLRSLAGNTLVFIDSPGVDNAPTTLAGTFASSVFTPASGLITILPQSTALVGVVPSVFGVLPFDPTPIPTTDRNFEVRGFVRLTLPAIRRNRFFSSAQATEPVKVMVTPQYRTTYLTDAGVLSDQTQASVPTSSGGSVGLVTPEPSRFMFPEILQPVRPDLMIDIPIEIRPDILMSLLADLDTDPASVAALNRALGEMDVPLALERRRARTTRPAEVGEPA